jgi:DNA-binding transcriptional MerR regulator
MGKKNMSHQNNGMISVKDIMQKYSISYHAINHYTDFGLLSLAFKKGNVRFYDDRQVRQRLVMITKLSREGYSLRLIRRKLLGV